MLSISQTTDTNNISAIYGGTGSSGETGQGSGQSFIARHSWITEIGLKTYQTGLPTDSLTLQLTSALGGTPLGSVTPLAASISGVGTETSFKFSTSIRVVVGQTYYIQVTRTGVRDTSNYRSLYLAYTTNPYTNGQTFGESNTVWTLDSPTTSDLWFKVYARIAGLQEFNSSHFTEKLLYNKQAGGFVDNDVLVFDQADNTWNSPYFNLVHDQSGDFLLDQTGKRLYA